MKRTLKKMLVAFAAAIGLATAAIAATPVAVWDGDFTTAGKGGYALSLKSGNALPTTVGNVALANDVLKLDMDSGSTAYANGAIVVKYSGYAAHATLANTALASAYVPVGSEDAGARAEGGILKSYWGTTVSRTLDKQLGSYVKDNVAIPANGYLILAYSTSTGTAVFLADADKTEWKGGYDSGIKWTGKTVQGFAIGGPRQANPATTMGPCATMTVEAVALFENFNGLTQAGVEELMAYQFPSEEDVDGNLEIVTSTPEEGVMGVAVTYGTWATTATVTGTEGEDGTLYRPNCANQGDWGLFHRFGDVGHAKAANGVGLVVNAQLQSPKEPVWYWQVRVPVNLGNYTISAAKICPQVFACSCDGAHQTDENLVEKTFVSIVQGGETTDLGCVVTDALNGGAVNDNTIDLAEPVTLTGSFEIVVKAQTQDAYSGTCAGTYGGLAGIVIQQAPRAFTATVAADTAFSALDWTPAKPMAGFGAKDVLTITNTAAAKVTFDGAVTARSIVFENAEGNPLTLAFANEPALTVGTWDFAGAVAGVVVDAPGLDGTELAKNAVAGAPYAEWVWRPSGEIVGADKVSATLPTVPPSYAVTSETLPGYGIRRIVTAGATVKWGSVSMNIHRDDSATLSGAGNHGLHPIDLADWGNIKVANGGSATKDGLTFTFSSSVGGYGVNNPPPDMIQKQYMDDNNNGVTRSITVSGMTAKGFAKYRAIVYYSTDSADISFAPLSVSVGEETDWYAGPSEGVTTAGVTVKGSQNTWGHTGPNHSGNALGEGVNALVTDVMTADSITLNFLKQNGKRATPCAIQIVEVGAAYVPTAYALEVADDTALSTAVWTPAKTRPFTTYDTLTVTCTAESAKLTLDQDLAAAKLTVVSAAGKRLTLKRNADIAANVLALDFSGAADGIGWDATEGYTACDVLKNYLQDNETTITFFGADANGAALEYGSGQSKTFKSHLIFDGGTHTFAYGSGAGGNFAVNATAANPTLFVKDQTTLDFKGRDLGGWQGAASLSAIVQVAAGGRLNAKRLDGTFYYRNRLTLEPGATLCVDMNADDFRLQGGTAKTTAQLCVPASENGVATVIPADATRDSIYMNHDATIGYAVDVGAGSTLDIQTKLATKTAEDAYELKKWGAGTLKLSGGLSGFRGVFTVAEGTALVAPTAFFSAEARLKVAADATLQIDAGSATVTLANTIENSGTLALVGGNVIIPATLGADVVTVDGGTAIFADRSAVPTHFTSGSIGYVVTLNDCGSFTVPTGVDATKVRLFNSAGVEQTVTKVEGQVLSFATNLYGTSCLMEYLFPGNLASTGSDTGAMAFDGTHCFPGNEYVTNAAGEKVGGIYAASAPWRNVTFPSEVTVVMYGKVMKTDNSCQIGIGSTTQGSKYTLFLASGDVSKEEVKLGYAKNNSGGNVAEKGVLCTMSVPHAQTTDHLYAFTLKQVGDDTVVNIYLDGEVLQPYAFRNQTVTLGNGIQLGSIHGGVGDSQNWPDDFGFKRSTDVETEATLQFLRVYNVVLNDTVMRQIAKDYPYASPSGSFSRDLAAEGSWVETDAWTKALDPTPYAVPDAGASVTITPTAGDVSLTVNLDADAAYEALTVNQGGKVTFRADAEKAGLVNVSGKTTVSTDVTLGYDAVRANGAVAIAEGKTLGLDLTSIALKNYWTDTSVKVTGPIVVGTLDQITVTTAPEAEGRTCAFAYNETTRQTELNVTVPKTDIVGTVGAEGAIAWIWGEAALSVTPDWTKVAATLVVPADATWEYDSGMNLTNIVVDGTVDVGTTRGLTFAGAGTVEATVTAEEREAGTLTVFTRSGEGVFTVRLYDEEGTELTGFPTEYDADGNYVVTFFVNITIADVAHATKTVEGATLASGTAYRAIPGATVTVTYTADAGYHFVENQSSITVSAAAAADIEIKTEAKTEVYPASLVNYYEFKNAEDLLKVEPGYGTDGKAYDSSVEGKAPVAKTGNYTLQAVTTNGANAVYLPTGASFGFDHGTDGMDWCIEMRILIPAGTSHASLFSIRQANDDDGYVFYGSDQHSIGGGSSWLDEENPPTPCTPETWHKVVIAFVKGMPMLYVDGVPQRAVSGSTGWLNNAPKIFMGADDDEEDLPYYLDYVKIYNVTMPPELGYAPIEMEGCGVWSGHSAENENWSTASNWVAGIEADSTRTATFGPATRVRLDGNKTVSDFVVWDDSTAFFYNDDPFTTNCLNITDIYRVGYSGSTVEFNGNMAVTFGTAFNQASKTIVSDGATLMATKLNYNKDPNQQLIAKGEGSLITLGSIAFSTTAGKNTGEALRAYDGGTINITTGTAMKPLAAFTVVATNHAEITASALQLAGAYSHKVTCNDSYMVLNQFGATGGGAYVKVGGTGQIEFSSTFNLPGNNNNAQTIALTGSGPEIYVKGGGTTQIGTGNPSYAGKQSLELTPEPTWQMRSGRINKKAKASSKFTLNEYVNFKVNCSGFANYYGKRRMALLNQATDPAIATGVSTFNLPTGSYVTKSGTGAANCELAFDSTATTLYMTITSTNATPPAAAVAGVNNIGKETIYYEALEAAVAAAAAEEAEEVDVVVVKDVLLDGMLAASRPITLYALEQAPVTITGDIDTTNITLGENITHVLPTVTFTVPAVDNATYVVSNDNRQLEAPYKAAPGSDVIVTYRTNEGYLFADGNDTKQVTVPAVAGELPTGVTSADVTAAKAKIGTVYYLTLNAAAAAAQDGDTVTLLADAAADGIACGAKVTLDINGQTLTVATGFATTTDLTLVNGVAGQGGFVVGGTVSVNGGTLDASALAVAAGGVIPGQAGGIAVANGATFAMMNEWAGISPNWLAANRPGFLTAADGGMVKMGSTVYTAQDGLFGTANTVAKAEVFVTDVAYVDTFETLAAALSAVKEGGTVTLLADVVTETVKVSPNKTLDIGAQTLTIPAGAMLALDGALRTSATGYNFINLGQMTIAPTASVYMGENKVFGEGGKFTLATDTLVVQTANVAGDPSKGMKYTISSDGAATMLGDFPEWEPGVYNLDTFWLDDGATLTAASASVEQGLTCVKAVNPDKKVVCNAGVYSVTAKGFILTIVKGDGVTSVTTNGIAVSEIEAREGDVITFELKSDYTVPVYSNGTEIVLSVYEYTAQAAATLTFTAIEGGSNPDVPAEAVNWAIVDAVDDPEDKVAIAAQVVAIEEKTNPDTGKSYTANEVAAWIKNNEINSAAMAQSEYTQASIALNTGLLDESEVKVSEMTMGETVEFTVDLNSKVVKEKGIESMVEICGDVGTADWGTVAQKSELASAVQIDKGTGKITITPVPGVSSLFIRVCIPKDK